MNISRNSATKRALPTRFSCTSTPWLKHWMFGLGKSLVCIHTREQHLSRALLLGQLVTLARESRHLNWCYIVHRVSVVLAVYVQSQSSMAAVPATPNQWFPWS
jgi:hypothetical protein